jgi:hypothetical protein
MMGYALALGDVDAWDHVWVHSLAPADVFVLRLGVTGAELRSPSDALLFARAAGQGQNLALDVRGVAVWQAGDVTMVDVVLTTPALRVGVLWADDAQAMGGKVAADETLRRVFPNLHVASVVFGQLTGPADAIDHWRSQPMLWDHSLPGPKNLGGPTDSMAVPGQYNVVKGKADDGSHAAPWVETKPPLGPAPGAPASGTMLLAGLGVGAAVLLLRSQSSKGHRRS